MAQSGALAALGIQIRKGKVHHTNTGFNSQSAERGLMLGAVRGRRKHRF
jgi:hypothetical protein